jgi:hypothetical protein
MHWFDESAVITIQYMYMQYTAMKCTDRHTTHVVRGKSTAGAWLWQNQQAIVFTLRLPNCTYIPLQSFEQCRYC